MRGRPPIPRELRLLRNGTSVPQAQDICPQCPEWLDCYAKEEWDRVAPELFRLGLLTEKDVTALSAYCQSYATWRKCEEAMSVEGMVSSGSRGQVRQHPCFKMADDALKQIHRFVSLFGLSPSSRARMEIEPPNAEGDEFDDFTASGGKAG